MTTMAMSNNNKNENGNNEIRSNVVQFASPPAVPIDLTTQRTQQRLVGETQPILPSIENEQKSTQTSENLNREHVQKKFGPYFHQFRMSFINQFLVMSSEFEIQMIDKFINNVDGDEENNESNNVFAETQRSSSSPRPTQSPNLLTEDELIAIDGIDKTMTKEMAQRSLKDFRKAQFLNLKAKLNERHASPQHSSEVQRPQNMTKENENESDDKGLSQELFEDGFLFGESAFFTPATPTNNTNILYSPPPMATLPEENEDDEIIFIDNQNQNVADNSQNGYNAAAFYDLTPSLASVAGQSRRKDIRRNFPLRPSLQPLDLASRRIPKLNTIFNNMRINEETDNNKPPPKRVRFNVDEEVLNSENEFEYHEEWVFKMASRAASVASASMSDKSTSPNAVPEPAAEITVVASNPPLQTLVASPTTKMNSPAPATTSKISAAELVKANRLRKRSKSKQQLFRDENMVIPEVAEFVEVETEVENNQTADAIKIDDEMEAKAKAESGAPTRPKRVRKKVQKENLPVDLPFPDDDKSTKSGKNDKAQKAIAAKSVSSKPSQPLTKKSGQSKSADSVKPSKSPTKKPELKQSTTNSTTTTAVATSAHNSPNRTTARPVRKRTAWTEKNFLDFIL